VVIVGLLGVARANGFRARVQIREDSFTPWFTKTDLLLAAKRFETRFASRSYLLRNGAHATLRQVEIDQPVAGDATAIRFWRIEDPAARRIQ
jgi:hypothetical protein